jgi:hypothetical protein
VVSFRWQEHKTALAIIASRISNRTYLNVCAVSVPAENHRAYMLNLSCQHSRKRPQSLPFAIETAPIRLTLYGQRFIRYRSNVFTSRINRLTGRWYVTVAVPAPFFIRYRSNVFTSRINRLTGRWYVPVAVPAPYFIPHILLYGLCLK